MTVRIPKWLLWGVAVAALVAIGFAIGRAGGNGETDHLGAEKTTQTPAAKEAVCSKPMAEVATLDTEFDDEIRAGSTLRAVMEGGHPSEVPFFSEEGTDYQVGILECADLTGDGLGEMVVGLSAGASGRVFHWAIFTPDDGGRWALAFDREFVSTSSLEIMGNAVLTRIPIYGRDDPLCCPAGYKSVRVAFRDGKFQVTSPRAPSEERLIRTEGGRVTSIGPLAAGDSPTEAVAAFGRPTGLGSPSDSVCRFGWDELGLSIDFANFGGGDPCGPEGRIGYFELAGAAAEQSGWRTEEGARVGSSVTGLEDLYPGSIRSGAELTLVAVSSPIGSGGTIPVMVAYLVDGSARAYRFYVGAAGE